MTERQMPTTPDSDWPQGPGLTGALWRYRWAVLVVAVLSALAGYVHTVRQPPVYQSVAQVELANPYNLTLFRQERGVPFTDIDRYMNVKADLVKAPAVMTRASQLLNGRLLPGQIRQHVSAKAVPDVFKILITSQLDDPQQAAAVANAVTQAYQDVSLERVQAQVDASVAELSSLQTDLRRRLLLERNEAAGSPDQAERDALSQELAELQTAEGQIRADAAVYGAGIDRVEPALPPEAPVSDSPRRDAAVWGVLGFLAALIVAFWRSERVRTVEGEADAAAVLGVPHLGTLAAGAATTPATAAAVVSAPGSRGAVAYDFISTSLAVMERDSEPRVLLVTSPEQASSKSLATLNLALASAMDDREVVLADVDPAARLTRMLGADGLCGVADLIARTANDGDFALADCVATIPGLPPITGFSFVPAGSGERTVASVATSGQLSKLLARLLQESDLVFLDGPPLLQAPDAMRLAAGVDGVVLVVGRRTPVASLREASRLLATAGATVLGYVFDPTAQTRSRRTLLRARARWRSRSR
jgi:Mrp family chromosome partitioning ATPase